MNNVDVLFAVYVYIAFMWLFWFDSCTYWDRYEKVHHLSINLPYDVSVTLSSTNSISLKSIP